MEDKRLTVGLLWHSANSPNLGIGALTIANMALIRRVAVSLGLDVNFVILGWQDSRPPYVGGDDVMVVPFRPREHLKRPDRLIAVIRRCDAVFDIGAGDSFSDLYGARRFLYMSAMKTLVLALARPLVLSPQTIGPYRRHWTRALAAGLMRRAEAVVARDRLSLEVLGKMGITRNCREATDVAFELPADDVRLAPADKIRVGINISGLLFNGGPALQRRLGLTVDYAALTARIVERFAARKDCEVHLVGHVLADDPVEDDRRAIAALAARFPSVVTAPEFASPTAAKGYIAAMDFFAGARMHACIAAFSSGVPVVPMAYSRKFGGLFGSLGYSCLADCTRESAPAILDSVLGHFAHRDRLRAEVAAGRRTARRRLSAYEEVIAGCLDSARQARPWAQAVEAA